MIIKAYSIFDRKALSYGPPFFAATDGAAIRSLSDLVSDPNTTVGRHPGDFVLYHIGSYDDQKGIMEPLSPLNHVVDAIALVPAQADLPFAQSTVHVAPNGDATVNLDRRR